MCSIGGVRGWFRGCGAHIKSARAQHGNKVIVVAVAAILVAGTLFAGVLYALPHMKPWVKPIAIVGGLALSMYATACIFDPLFQCMSKMGKKRAIETIPDDRFVL